VAVHHQAMRDLLYDGLADLSIPEYMLSSFDYDGKSTLYAKVAIVEKKFRVVGKHETKLFEYLYLNHDNQTNRNYRYYVSQCGHFSVMVWTNE
jgi:hypothetical protein